MVSTRWRKVFRELWLNRTRTVLVIVSIAVGIFAVGAVQLLRSVILTELKAVYASSNASQAALFVAGADQGLLDSIRRMPEVADAQGRSNLVVKVQVGEEWKNITLVAVEDFEEIRINRIQPDGALAGPPAWRREHLAGER